MFRELCSFSHCPEPPVDGIPIAASPAADIETRPSKPVSLSAESLVSRNCVRDNLLTSCHSFFLAQVITNKSIKQTTIVFLVFHGFEEIRSIFPINFI